MIKIEQFSITKKLGMEDKNPRKNLTSRHKKTFQSQTMCIQVVTQVFDKIYF